MTKIQPWYSPRLSQSMMGVLNALGHTVYRKRGDEIYSSPGFFDKLMFVRQGVVAKALLDPIREEPLLLSLSSKGALCGGFENLYVRDRLSRRHYCLTNTELLVVNKELLLRIADQNPEWHRELSNYSSVAALCDRLGVLANHSGTVAQRLGALLLLLLNDERPEQLIHLKNPSVEWVELPFILGARSVSYVIDTDVSTVNQAIKEWVGASDIRYRAHKLWIRRKTFYEYWVWINQLIEQTHDASR